MVTYPPGGTVDVVARLIGPKLAAELGQPVVIENRGGAGGMIGGAVVARPSPTAADAGRLEPRAEPALHSRMQFDTLTAFAPVSLLLRVPNVLVVTPSYEVKTVADLIKLGQPDQEPCLLRLGRSRPSTWPASCSTCWPRPSCSTWPTRGGGPAMIDVMSGQVPVMFASMGSAWQHVKNGKLRAVALGGSTRSPAAPDLPTIAESGVPGYETYEWNAVFAPAGTPPEVVTQLSQALAKVLKDPAIAEQLAGIGAEPIGSTPAELDTFRRAEIEKWQRVVKEANLKLD